MSMQEAYDFIKKEAVVDTKGVSHITQNKYMTYMKSQGLTEELIKSYYNAHSDLVQAADKYNGERLLENIEEAKKAGRDATKEKVVTVINIYKGSLRATTCGLRVRQNPAKPGTTVNKTGTFTVDFNQDRMADKQLREEIEAKVAKAYGL